MIENITKETWKNKKYFFFFLNSTLLQNYNYFIYVFIYILVSVDFFMKHKKLHDSMTHYLLNLMIFIEREREENNKMWRVNWLTGIFMISVETKTNQQFWRYKYLSNCYFKYKAADGVQCFIYESIGIGFIWSEKFFKCWTDYLGNVDLNRLGRWFQDFLNFKNINLSDLTTAFTSFWVLQKK